jgi:WhiB family transcriptional regulator, redox-sensing transcriptional regulator
MGKRPPLPCQTQPLIFFAERYADAERAKALCHDCPVRQACLAGARERAEPWGVWGGEVFVDGVVVPAKRGRGRPRRVAAAA